MALNDRKIKSLKPSKSLQKVSDGGGLQLHVTPQGGKLWRMAYRYDGKQKTLAFGPYPAVSLAEARKKRDVAKQQLAKGLDPRTEEKLDRINAERARGQTFNAVADELLEKDAREGRAETTLRKKRWLLDLVRSELGPRPIADISAPEVLAPLREIEAKGNYETAQKLRGTIGQVFRYAIATARAESDPTYALRGALTSPITIHRAAFTDKVAFAGLVRAIWGYEGTAHTRTALQLLAFLYPRPGELRLAQWIEFDLEAGVWELPAERTKMRRPHKKPLPSLAIDLLQELRQVTGHREFLFPSLHSRGKPISENTLNGALRRLGFSHEEVSAHGFRASASSLLNESGKWNPDAIEAELGHVGADEVRRAYHRAAYWEERIKMAEWWAEEIASFIS